MRTRARLPVIGSSVTQIRSHQLRGGHPVVQGDRLKLIIGDDGTFIYKQIGPIERKKLIGKITLQDGTYMVEAGGKLYHVLFASVTYFKAQPGDEVTVVIPADRVASWAAIEAVIG